jgi:hypothetical protein
MRFNTGQKFDLSYGPIPNLHLYRVFVDFIGNNQQAFVDMIDLPKT